MPKVTRGQSVQISANDYNDFLTVARDHKDGKTTQIPQSQPGPHPASLIRVQNNSGAIQTRWAVLGVDGVVVSPDTDEAEFQNHPTLVCSTPNLADHTGQFVILAEPLAIAATGWAYAFGCCPARVLMTQLYHTYADVCDGETICLESDVAGHARIWLVDTLKEGESVPIVKWAFVILGETTAPRLFQATGAENLENHYIPGKPVNSDGTLANEEQNLNTLPDYVP